MKSRDTFCLLFVYSDTRNQSNHGVTSKTGEPRWTPTYPSHFFNLISNLIHNRALFQAFSPLFHTQFRVGLNGLKQPELASIGPMFCLLFCLPILGAA